MLQSVIVRFEAMAAMASGHGKLIDTINAWGPTHDLVINTKRDKALFLRLSKMDFRKQAMDVNHHFINLLPISIIPSQQTCRAGKGFEAATR